MIIGAALGLAGSLANRVGSYLEKKQEMDAEEKRHAYTLEQKKLEIQGAKDVANIEASSKTQVASYEHDTNVGQGSQWVVNLLRLVRPAITGYAMVLITLFWFTLPDKVEIQATIVAALLETLSMSVAWWFGDRGRR